MITRFDKNGIAAHFRRRFSECIENRDFEGAVDYLIKYSDEKHNADFHLACGMLYLQLCLDSDDNELACMAYREFMLHLQRAPDCRNAYRDLLIALLLRRDGGAFIENCKWLKRRGIDFHAVLGELVETGILFAMPDDAPPEFDDLFAGEYGEIMGGPHGAEPDARPEPAGAGGEKPQSKILHFGGAKPSSGKAPEDLSGFADKIIRLAKRDDEFSDDDSFTITGMLSDDDTEPDDMLPPDSDEEFNDFINAYLYGDEYDDADNDAIAHGLDSSDMSDGLRTGAIPFDACEAAEQRRNTPAERAIRIAEDAYEAGDAEGALRALEKIGPGDEQYYFALTMRALIHMEAGRYGEAEVALDEANRLRPEGALGGALLCQLYEYEKRYDDIPAVLKRIDVKDYVNAAHLYRSFNMALKYCSDEDAAELLERYIDEFNIMEMRLVYAQILYNLGERDYAIDELYTLSRIFYDDVNARYFYLLARSGVDKFKVDVEAPQSVLSALAENFMATVLSGSLTKAIVEHEVFTYGMEFFLTLEFRNERRLMIKMFETIRALTKCELLKEKLNASLVSPYVEPIVKATILGELLADSKGAAPFLAEVAYCPIASDDVEPPKSGMPRGYYIAYAFIAMLCKERLRDLASIADRCDLTSADGEQEKDLAYYLFCKASVGDRAAEDDRLPFAFGYASRSVATRALKATDAAVGADKK